MKASKINSVCKRPKSKVVEHAAPNQVHGLGVDVVKILDAETGESICFIGYVKEKEQVHFSKPATFAQIEAVADLLHRKKFRKHLANGKIEKAEHYADKNFQIK